MDLPLPRGDRRVARGAFTFLFAELVRRTSSSVATTNELEAGLSSVGQRVGLRMLELLAHRELNDRRPLDILAALKLVHTNVWRCLFGKAAERLERSSERPDQYYIYDSAPLTNTFVSVPKDLGALNVAAFGAGIIKGVLDHSGFPANVTAHFNNDDHDMTIFVIQFEPHVLERNS